MVGSRCAFLSVLLLLCFVDVLHNGYVEATAINDEWDESHDIFKRAADNCDEDIDTPTEINYDRLYSTAARVYWSEVEAADWYTVRVKTPASTCIRGAGDVFELEATFRDLDADTTYVVDVVAHHVNGCSEPKEITFQTRKFKLFYRNIWANKFEANNSYLIFPAVKIIPLLNYANAHTEPGSWRCADSTSVPGPVVDLTLPVGNISSSSVLVTWSPTPVALTYKVEIVPPNIMFSGLGTISTESTTIRRLSPGYVYQVKVTAQNRNAEGPPSLAEFVTRIELPPELVIANTSSTHMEISWEIPRHSVHYTLILYQYESGGDTYEVKRDNTTGSRVLFQGLQPATQYLVTYQAFNHRASSPVMRLSLYTKLPTTRSIRISNVTDHSVLSKWAPVVGATTYQVILRNYHDNEIVKNYIVNTTFHLLDDLNDASKYQLEIFARNEFTNSLPGVAIVYTRLKQLLMLNVDQAHVQDKSLVIRWERMGGAEWYNVSIDSNATGLIIMGNTAKEYMKLENLIPGTLYHITVVAKNHKVFDTASLPAMVEQFTRLSQPLNVSIKYEDVMNTSMRVTWSPVPHADTYLLLVYDCSGLGRTIGQIIPRNTSSTENEIPAEYRQHAVYWTYSYPRVESVSLECEHGFDSVEHAVWQGENELPSDVVGQGRTNTTDVTLTNMVPATRYEIVIVSGKREVQSNPSIIRQYTSYSSISICELASFTMIHLQEKLLNKKTPVELNSPANFHINETTVRSSTVVLMWEPVEGMTYYNIEILYTPTRTGVANLNHFRSLNVTHHQTVVTMLQPSTNYTFRLTAVNENTSSFVVDASAFTRLPSPPTLNVVPEQKTTDALLLQWTPVENAQFYNVTFVASNSRIRRQTPIYRNVTSAEIHLHGLMPNTLYQISILAQNKYTRSLPSHIDTFTDLPTPENFTVAEVTDSTIRLEWSDVEGRDEFRLAAVRYPAEPETYRYTTDVSTYTLDVLPPNQPFRIWMVAVNDNTQSRVSEIIQYTKLPRPQQVAIIDVSDTKLTLRWASVTDAVIYSVILIPLRNESQPIASSSINSTLFTDVIRLSRNGETGFRVRRSTNESKSRQKRVRRTLSDDSDQIVQPVTYRSKIFTSSRRFTLTPPLRIYPSLDSIYYINITYSDVTFSDLEAGVKYKVTLKAVNQHTDSLPVSRQTFTELMKPRSVECRDVTNDTMMIRWLSVEKAAYYTVSVVPEVRNWLSSASSSGVGNTTSSEVLIEGLQPNTNYTVTVLAGNNHVISKRAVKWKITKLSATENLRVVNSSVMHDRFHLKWNRVAYANSYVIIISPPPVHGRAQAVVSNGATEITLRNLRDGTRYQVTVTAQNDRTGGVERSLSKYTKLLTPSPVKVVNGSVTSSSFNVSWGNVPKADLYSVVVGNSTQIRARSLITRKIVYLFSTFCVIVDLESGKQYWVTVTAKNMRQNTYSDSVTVNTFTKLETPGNFFISDDDVTDSSMVVTWSHVPLATLYMVRYGVEHREGDHYSVFLRINREEVNVTATSVSIRGLHPASYYLIDMMAVNEDTQSFTVSLNKFTKLPRPSNVNITEGFFMDTEAEIEWTPVQQAEYYMLKIYEQDETTQHLVPTSYIPVADIDSDISGEEANDSSLSTNTTYSTLVSSIRVDGRTYFKVTNLRPLTHYQASVEAFNRDSNSDGALFLFVTKSPCSDDYHHFPNTHLSRSLPRRTFTNSSVQHCLEQCCQEREFNCRSTSLHRKTSACLIYAEDRNTAPPLAISATYDHYERKFWREVSGFQIRSLSHNNVAVMNETVEITLTFVYLGKTGCVVWDFGDNLYAYHSILNTNCSYLCDNSADENCTIINADPNNNMNQITIAHDYDMETVFEVVANVTDGNSYEVSRLDIAINERGCIYPSINIEDEGKIKIEPKKIFKSSKLLLSATPLIICNNFPGVRFEWNAISYAADHKTQTNQFPLRAVGSEILVPSLTFATGLYKISVKIELLDEEHDLQDDDLIYLLVGPSPLVAKIRGGGMRTVGAKRVVTWDSLSESYDPDVLGEERNRLEFTWFCKNYTDDRFLPLSAGSCIEDMSQVTFTQPGVFSLNTSLLHLYKKYEFRIVVRKGSRSNEFKQQITVKEGDPPDFHINCVDNCKFKMNPTQALALRAVCGNCKLQRNPTYKWRLFEVVPHNQVGGGSSSTGEEPTLPPPITQATVAPMTETEERVSLVEVFNWENSTTTGSDTPIVVLNKHTLNGGKRFILRMNISMDGLDGRVFSYSDFVFLTNLPPRDGICQTAESIGNCDSFIPLPNQNLFGVSHKKILSNATTDKCSEYCCLTREFMCLSFSYNPEAAACVLFDRNKDSHDAELIYESSVIHYQRLFYRGGAVVDEVVFTCSEWKDEGELLNYPEEGGKSPKTSLTYKFTTVPQGNQTKGLLLYFGNVQTTPGISMALGDPGNNFSVSVIAQVCDSYGECALSNIIYLQIAAPSSTNMGSTLSGITSGNGSKLAILSDTGNSKAAAQLVQSISSLINMDDDVSESIFGNQTTVAWVTTVAPTTVYMTTVAYNNRTRNGTAGGISREEKRHLRSDIVNALSTASSGITSLDNLQQMTSAMTSITERTDEIEPAAQQRASNTVRHMAGSLSSFSEESTKEDVTSAASNIVGSLGSVAKASETDMSELQSQMMQSSDVDYSTLDQEDLSPEEHEYYNRRRLKQEKRRVRRSALGSQDVVGDALEAISSTANALLGKQMEGEQPVDVSSDRLEMKLEKTSPAALKDKTLSTDSGTSLKLPDATSLLGRNASNITEPVDMQVTAFKDNPFGFGDDAAFINSPVTMLKIGGMTENSGANMSGDGNNNGGVGVSIPSKFDPARDMVTVVRSINDTGLSISKFEVISKNNAILILLEPHDRRAKFDVYIRHGSKPTDKIYDHKFRLPKKIWQVDGDEDLFKIFIKEEDVGEVGVFYIGVRDHLNISSTDHSRVRRRRSVEFINSTTYHILIATPGCRRFDEKTKAWTGDGCLVDERSTPEVTECVCTKLSPTSIFSAEFFVPPNTINFATVWAKVNIADNPAVFSTVIALVCLYILMLIWTTRMDRRDAQKWSLKSTVDNRKEDRYLYQVTVFTGHSRNAATQSQVSCIIFGENGKSKVRRMATHETQNPYTRSSVVHFLLREPKCLGPLTHLHIWHDNKGKGDMRSWYLDQVVVQDVRTGKRFFFISDQWLAVDHDDGKVDRVLPVATPENMSTFHRLFVSTTTQKFTEDHLWISLFYRPTKSNFTRTQRLSCCAALLFMTMIANAMFFERGSSSAKTGTTGLKVGPFTISPLQIWTSFCSTMMVVPVTTIVMLLFKKSKTKEQSRIDKEEKEALRQQVNKFNKKVKAHSNAASLPEPSDLVGCEAVYKINEDGTINAKPNIGAQDAPVPPSQWPHWCVYIAWTLTSVAVILSGFFSIMYSFEWGKDKANRWLSNMMLSFWQSVFIVQPIKVVLLSMFVATIVKKPDQQALDSVEAREVREAERNFINLCANDIESELQEKEAVAPPKPPSKKKLRKARKLREKEKAMSQIIWEVIAYFFYIMILLFLCHGNRDSKGHSINNHIKKTFSSSTFGLNTVSSVEYFYRFVNQTLLPNLYPNHWYNGDKKSWRDRSFLTDEQSYRVGPARLRQIRVNEHQCPMVAAGQRRCRGHFQFFDEETRSFAPGWRPLPNITTPPNDEIDEDPSAGAWRHQTWMEMRGVPFVGSLAVYPGGGYSAELGVNLETGKLVMDALYKDAWVDEQTRAVFCEFTVYNPNVNLFTSVLMVVEFPPVGSAVTMESIMTFRLYQYLGAYGVLMVLAQVIFFLHLLTTTINFVIRIFRQRRLLFNDPWNYFDFSIIVMEWTVTGLYIFQLVVSASTLRIFHENKRKFVNFQQVSTIDMMVATTLALSAFFGIIRFLKLLRFNRKIGMLTLVLKNSARQWPGFFVMALVFFIAFIHIGYLVFCPFLEGFKNVIQSVETMFGTMMGRPLYENLRNHYRIFGPIFYFIFCFTSAFIILNILIAIINESYGMTLEAINSQSNQYEIVDFMMQRFSKWSGIQLGNPIERKVRPAPISPSKVPLPPLPYKIEHTYGSHLLNFQKNLDKHVYDLESKYNKYLSIEEFRDQVLGEMAKVSKRNNGVQSGLVRQRYQSINRSERSRSMTINQTSSLRTSPNGDWSTVGSATLSQSGLGETNSRLSNVPSKPSVNVNLNL
ncbi:uncharacterized protein LOC100175984 [Ciona intestinalis]